MKRTAALMMISSLVLLSGCAQRPIETIRGNGDFLYDHGDYVAAAEEYGAIVELYPGDWRALYQLGRCRLVLDDPTGARQVLEVAYTNHPGDADIADALAESMFQIGDEERLFEFLRQCADSGQSVRAWLRLARYSSELGDADTAQAAYETAIAIDEGRTTEPYLEAAEFAQAIGDVDEALRRLRQAYYINPRDSRVNQRLRDLGEVPGPTIALPPGA